MSVKQVKLRLKDRLQQIRLFVTFGVYRLLGQPPKNMVILMVDGGFASVLLKMCIGLWFEKRWKCPVKYDLSWFDRCGCDMDGKQNRNFDLFNVYPGLPFDVANEKERSFYQKHFRYKNYFINRYDERRFYKARPLYLDGYYGSWRYIVDVREEFLMRAKFDFARLPQRFHQAYVDIMASEMPIAVHIRRGDFVGMGLSFLGAQYFLGAIQYLRAQFHDKKTKIFVFSNGPDWVRSFILPFVETDCTLVDCGSEEQGYYDLLLMSQCKSHVLSNSGFSFFGAFLCQHPGQLVVVPDKMDSFGTPIDESFLGVPGWIRVSSETGVFCGTNGINGDITP